jgi:N-acetylmuramoyl-L-alanine amidase
MVYVDAFYGGEETGPTINEVQAKILTLNIAKKIVRSVNSMGTGAHLLRKDDGFLSSGEKIRMLHKEDAKAYLGVKIDESERDCIHIVRPSEKSSYKRRDGSKLSSDDLFPNIAILVKKRSTSLANMLQEKLVKTSMCVSIETSSDQLLEASSHARPTVIVDFRTTGSRDSFLFDKKKMDEISATISLAIDSFTKGKK